MPAFRLLLVTDRRASAGPLEEAIAAVLRAAPRGSVAIQLREKDLDGGPLYALAGRLRELTSGYGAPLLVNDRVDVALAVAAEGVHLPANGLPVREVRRLFPEGLVGVSAHSPREVAAARDAGADYAVLGPIYDTPSKRPFGRPLGPGALREASRLSIPVFAIGGISPERAPEVLAAGASGIACVSAVLAAVSPAGAASELLAAWGAALPRER